MKNILVSVIVPIYNSEKYIERCINSILNQTYKNIELILIDDGSKDESFHICQKYEKRDKRVNALTQKNFGVSYTRNKGIDSAKGDFIMFVDSDDCIEKTMIEDMVNKVTDTNVDLIISGIRMNYININEIVEKKEYKLEDKNYSKQELLNAILKPIELICICGPCCKLYSKEKLQKYNIRFSEELTMGEDTWFNLDYLSICNGNIVTLKNIYYNYMRENKESLFSKYYDNYINVTEKVYNKFLALLEKETNIDTINRFKKMYAINLMYANSINFKHATTKTKKIYDIKYTMNSKIVQYAVKELETSSIKEKILFISIKRKWWCLLYLYFKMKYRKV